MKKMSVRKYLSNNRKLAVAAAELFLLCGQVTYAGSVQVSQGDNNPAYEAGQAIQSSVNMGILVHKIFKIGLSAHTAIFSVLGPQENPSARYVATLQADQDSGKLNVTHIEPLK